MQLTMERDTISVSQQAMQDVVSTCHIITKLNLDSGPFGNISVRIPGTDTFWVNPEGITFEQLKPAHMVLVNVDGAVLEGNFKPHPGTFIHREIFKLRDDVNAIVHTHSDNSAMHSLLGVVIEPFTQLGASIHGDQGLYLGFTGPVRTSDEGAAIAEALGSKAIVIAKNHGLFAAGADIKSALWDFVVADEAAKIHLAAKQLGLNTADKLSEQFMQKSRIEVRQKQREFMWQAFMDKLA